MRIEPIRTKALTSEFLSAMREKIELLALEKAYPYYLDVAWEGFKRKNAQLKKKEQVVNFYDYDACVISALSGAARRGSSEAMRVMRKIVENTEYYLCVVRKEQGGKLPLRRLPLHMVISYQNIEHLLSDYDMKKWNKIMYKNAKLLLRYVHKFKPGGRTPYNRTLKFGLNHYCIVCEGIWMLGDHFRKKKWKRMAVGFSNRVMSFSPLDGYFEENTNIDHEGGPSLRYSPLSAGAMYHVQLWNNTLDEERFKKCDYFQRNMVDQNLNLMCFADERSNEKYIRPFGLALHSLTPEGREFLRAIMRTGGPLDPDTLDLQKLGRLYFEIGTMREGQGILSAPFTDGSYKLFLPLGIKRKYGWTAGLSLLKSLNREIAPHSDYALDRQNLLFLSHKKAGVILRGFKSKNDSMWSTVKSQGDAYPTENGFLRIENNRLSGRAFYAGFHVDICWSFNETIALILTSGARNLILQLGLELCYGQIIRVNEGRAFEINEDSLKIDGVHIIESDKWRMECDTNGRLLFPVAAFSPYTTNNQADRADQRVIFMANWSGAIRIMFRVLV